MTGYDFQMVPIECARITGVMITPGHNPDVGVLTDQLQRFGRELKDRLWGFA